MLNFRVTLMVTSCLSVVLGLGQNRYLEEEESALGLEGFAFWCVSHVS